MTTNNMRINYLKYVKLHYKKFPVISSFSEEEIGLETRTLASSA